ncbi:MAG: diaminopropionate ammonia-lyase [Gammaproteobacteria bacterium]|nr:diaminopropionate ammonia-lyase [Gammaproteobacteria bacterium]
MTLFKQSHIQHYAASTTDFEAAVFNTLTAEGFERAGEVISKWDGYQPTPLHLLPGLAAQCKVGSVLYKDESKRFHLRSFKALGGAYAAHQLIARLLTDKLGRQIDSQDLFDPALTDEIAQIHICTATDGNHGRSVAWGCQQIGAPCHIFIHAEVSQGRADAMAAFGAQINRINGNYDASVDAAKQASKDYGWHVVSDTSYEGYTQVPTEVMLGYGVLASEITEQTEEPPTHVFLQGGVGGMAAAIAARLLQQWPDVDMQIVIVEPEQADCLYQSAKAGKISVVDITDETVMAGLSCGEPSMVAWRVLEGCAQHFTTVPDALVAPTMQRLVLNHGDDPALEAGESAVAGVCLLLAASEQPALYTQLKLTPESSVLIIGSEGATDPEIYEALLKN